MWALKSVGVLYACKGGHALFIGQREGEIERGEREKGRERVRKRERKRETESIHF